MSIKSFSKLYKKAFPDSSREEIDHSEIIYNNIMLGAGGGLEFITDPKKRTELADQLKLAISGFSKGFGITGILGWAGSVWNERYNKDRNEGIYNLVVPLSSLILWHPVRGSGEREASGKKTTDRKNAVLEKLMNSEISYSQKKPFNSKQWNEIKDMNSTEEIQTIPVKFVEENEDIRLKKEEIVKKNESLKQAADARAERVLSMQLNNLIDELDALIKKNRKENTGFLILAGQGRIQAILEAVREAGINQDDFWLNVGVGDIPVQGCNILLDIHNYYIETGMFNDDRHKVWKNGNYVNINSKPVAFSCRKNITKKDLICYSKYDRTKYAAYSLSPYKPCNS